VIFKEAASLYVSNTLILNAHALFCPFSSGYTFHEAHGVAPVKIETNYPDVVSILMPRDFNGSHGTHERFVLQVCRGTQECF